MQMSGRASNLSLLLACLFAASDASSATITPISQERSVTARTLCSGSPLDTRSATNFAPFNQTAQVSYSFIECFGSASASQNSQILLEKIEASGSAQSSSLATATTIFRVVFSLDEASVLSLTGVIRELLGRAEVKLSPAGSSTPLFLAQATCCSNTPFSYTGFLAAGSYELSALAGTSVQLGGDFATFQLVAAIVPEPSTGLLMGSGLALFGGLRRFARQRSVA